MIIGWRRAAKSFGTGWARSLLAEASVQSWEGVRRTNTSHACLVFLSLPRLMCLQFAWNYLMPTYVVRYCLFEKENRTKYGVLEDGAVLFLRQAR